MFHLKSGTINLVLIIKIFERQENMNIYSEYYLRIESETKYEL